MSGSALQAAVYRGHEKIIELLLNKGADVNTQGGRHGSALQAAIAGRDKKIIELLLSKGADVNAQEGEYGNALQAAIVERDEKIIELLLNKGAHINAQGRTLATRYRPECSGCRGRQRSINIGSIPL
jgi:ankyrin repeat protein